MKPNHLIGIFLITMLFINFSFAQEACKVLKPEIAGKYTGDCKKGLAHGVGIAEGTDKYEGRFKNGLPNGAGIYKYANGDVYEGDFREGLKSGRGKFSFKYSGKDSTYQGIWENDQFIRKIVPPAYVINQKLNVQRYAVQKTGPGNRVMFTFMQNGMNNHALTGLTFAENSGSSISIGLDQGFDNIRFPFTCKVTYSTPNSFHTATYEVVFEIEISEPGQWLITLTN